MRVLAVDWSGDARQARRRIWLAEADTPGRLVRLEAGRDRAALTEHLLSLTRERDSADRHLPLTADPNAVIGLDFAFAFPAWYMRALGVSSGPELWALAAGRGEAWLAQCAPPFWGRRGPRPTSDGSPLRRAERAAPVVRGIRPRSVFQIGGAGAVGTGSVRGMPLLDGLHRAGARIWPFTGAGAPVLVEIYPRLLSGPVRKSDPAARASHLAHHWPDLADDHRALAIASEDAFDAAVSALVMVAHAADLACLPPEPDADLRLEGRIWHPGWRRDPV